MPPWMGSFDLWWQDETDKSWTRSGAIRFQLYSFSLPRIWGGKSSSVDHSWLGLGRELINSCWGWALLALLPKLPARGTVLVISEIFSWIFSPLWLCGPFIASLHSEWFTACCLSRVSLGKVWSSLGFSPAMETRLLDLRLLLHRENMAPYNRGSVHGSQSQPRRQLDRISQMNTLREKWILSRVGYLSH